MNKLAKSNLKQGKDGGTESKQKPGKPKKNPAPVHKDEDEDEQSNNSESVPLKRKVAKKQKEPTPKKAKKTSESSKQEEAEVADEVAEQEEDDLSESVQLKRKVAKKQKDSTQKKAKKTSKSYKEEEAEVAGEVADHAKGIPDTATSELTPEVNHFFVGRLPQPLGDGLSVVQFFAKHELEVTVKGKPENMNCVCNLADPEDSEKMMAMNGVEFDGNNLIIRKTQPTPTSGKRVCLQQLDPTKITNEDLREKTGATKASTVPAKRLGFLTFAEESEAKALVDQGTLTVNGCEMSVEIARARPNQRSNTQTQEQKNRTCFKCGKKGHVSRFCSQSKK